MSFKAQTQTPDSSQAPPAPCDRAPLHRQFFGNIGAQVMYQTSVGPRQQSVPLVREVKDAKTPPSVSTEKKKSAQTPTLSGNSLSSNDEREALKAKNATNQSNFVEAKRLYNEALRKQSNRTTEPPKDVTERIRTLEGNELEQKFALEQERRRQNNVRTTVALSNEHTASKKRDALAHQDMQQNIKAASLVVDRLVEDKRRLTSKIETQQKKIEEMERNMASATNQANVERTNETSALARLRDTNTVDDEKFQSAHYARMKKKQEQESNDAANQLAMTNYNEDRNLLHLKYQMDVALSNVTNGNSLLKDISHHWEQLQIDLRLLDERVHANRR
jgi:hypothetical protein